MERYVSVRIVLVKAIRCTCISYLLLILIIILYLLYALYRKSSICL